MTAYFVSVEGCDDETPIKVEGATGEQIEFLRAVAGALNAVSSGQCMPTMAVKAWSETSEYDRELVERAQERADERNGEVGS